MNKKDYIFQCENGITYGVKGKCCCICKHCSSLFYDYTNGPYMFSCELDEDTTECLNCNKFELEEGTKTIEEYEAYINSDEYKEQQKQIKKIVDDFLENKPNFLEKLFMHSLMLSAIPKIKLFDRFKKRKENEL